MPPLSKEELDALAEAALGSRVSVRYFLGRPGPSGGPAMSDVVGILEATTDGSGEDHPATWALRKADRTCAHVRTDTIASVRPAPGRIQRPRAADIGIEQLEQIASTGWQPLERLVLGDWYLRAADGFTGRANSVLPLGDVGIPLDAALADIEAFYRTRALPAKIQVPLPLKAKLDESLDERGWMAENTTAVMTADIDDVLARHDDRDDRNDRGDRIAPHAVIFDDAPSDAWMATYSYRGEPIPAIAKDVMTNTAHPVFVSIADSDVSDGGDELVAVARGAIAGSWFGITALDVVSQHRRQRLATTLVHALLTHAREQGCRFIYLQVAKENVGARAMYDNLGFTQHHHYHYRVKPVASPGNPSEVAR